MRLLEYVHDGGGGRDIGVERPAHSDSNGLKPCLRQTFKLPNDKHFQEKFQDVIGLYVNPSDKALVLCCDEKTQCQALECMQPGLPLGIGCIRTHTHDYTRHGTVTLFAALNYLDEKLIVRTEMKYAHVDQLRFLKPIDRETSKESAIHLIADNDCTHKHKKAKHGWQGIRASICTSRRPGAPG